MSRRPVALVFFILTLVLGAGFLSVDGGSPTRSGGDASHGRGQAALTLRTPAPTADAVIPVTVCTAAPARVCLLDVDLNHDGQFQGLGERAYAQGWLRPDGTGTVRLHGLVPGSYLVRARVTLSGGQEVVSATQRLQVLPPPANRLPVSFEPNQGQADSQVLFLGRTQNCLVYINAADTVLVTTTPRPARQKAPAPPAQVQRFGLVGANAAALPQGRKKLPGISNYFLGNDPSRWRSNIETYQEVVKAGVYPGIDLVYYSSQGRLEYDFRVAAGADPSLITLEFPDVTDLSIDEDGALVLHFPDGPVLRKSAPVMYQERRGLREAVKGDWVLKGANQARFVVAAYDPRRELVIDPIVFSTYYGGSLNDQGLGIGVDGVGNSYVTGQTLSVNFPTTAGVVQPAFGGGPAGNNDVFVVALNPAGTAAIYSTYLGGTGDEIGNGIAVDAAGNAYVTGDTTSANFPTTAGAFQAAFTPAPAGSYHAFVSKLNPMGTKLLYSTFLGGEANDYSYAIAIDAAGNAYISGNTTSTGPSQGGLFPITPIGPPGPSAVQTTNKSQDSFVAMVNATGTALGYCTFHGGTAAGLNTGGYGIAVDAAGNAYVTGYTFAGLLPTTAGCFQPNKKGNPDGYLLKLNPTGTARLYATFLGAGGVTFPMSLAIDGAGNAYVAGTTSSANFPTTGGAFRTSFQGGPGDAFVLQMNPAGSALVYATYLGGTGDDQGWGINVDAGGNAYVTGWTGSADFPTANATQAVYGGGAYDAFVTKLDPTGTFVPFSTFLGGSGTDQGNWVALDAVPAVYVVGTTTSTDFPTMTPAQAANGGGQDLFVTKLTVPFPLPPGVTVNIPTGTLNLIEGGASGIYTVVLDTAPVANVTITITPDAQETVAPTTLTFTPANWNVIQTVTVTAVNHGVYLPPHVGLITQAATSADPLYNGIAVASVTVNISSIPPPSTAGAAGSEGSFAGSQDPGIAGSEGSFGQSGHLAAAMPVLAGPFLDLPGSSLTPASAAVAAAPPAGTRLRVYNVSGHLRLQQQRE